MSQISRLARKDKYMVKCSKDKYVLRSLPCWAVITILFNVGGDGATQWISMTFPCSLLPFPGEQIYKDDVIRDTIKFYFCLTLTQISHTSIAFSRLKVHHDPTRHIKASSAWGNPNPSPPHVASLTDIKYIQIIFSIFQSMFSVTWCHEWSC